MVAQYCILQRLAARRELCSVQSLADHEYDNYSATFSMSKRRKRQIASACLCAVLVASTVYLILELLARKNTSLGHEIKKADGSVGITLRPVDVGKKKSKPVETSEESVTDAEQAVQSRATDAELIGFYVPLISIEPTQAQSQALYEAEESLVQQCMNERGFDYIANAYTDDSDLDSPAVQLLPGDVKAAMSRGYGLAESMDNDGVVMTDKAADVNSTSLSSAALGPNDAYLEGLNAEQQEAWDAAFMGTVSTDAGLPTGTRVIVESPEYGSISWDSDSCLAIARQQLYDSDVRAAEDLIAKYILQKQIYAQAETDVDYQTAMGQWRNCMAARGMGYEKPGDAANHLHAEYEAGRLSLDQLRALEIRIATIDADCYQGHSVGSHYNRALQRAEANVVDGNAGEVERLRQAMIDAVRRATLQTNLAF